MTNPLRLTLWPESTPPSESTLRAILQTEGLDFYAWSNGPNDVYAPHVHSYDKVLYCVHGSITFQLIELGIWHKLNPGDRLDLPAGTVHAAQVGEQGVTCFEAQR